LKSWFSIGLALGRQRLRAKHLDRGDPLGHRLREPVRQVGCLLLAASQACCDDLHAAILAQRDGPRQHTAPS
jgi:hypothetical protein